MIKPMSNASCYRPADRSVATTAYTSADSSSDTGVDNQARGGVVMVCVFAQQKGGVGKTTSAINAGVLLAQAGRRVLAGMVPFNVIALGQGRFHRATRRRSWPACTGSTSCRRRASWRAWSWHWRGR